MQELKPCILVVDDDIRILNLVRRILENEQYRVVTASSGEDALVAFNKQTVDMVLLDIIMPDMDGYAVCQSIRQCSTVSIIMLTAMDSNQDKVKGLDAGADDFVTKPFAADVLLARIRAVLRRGSGVLPAQPRVAFNNGRLEIDFANMWIGVNGREVKLTPTEFRLIQELVFNKGRVLTHTQLLQQVWGAEYKQENEYLHVFIRNLRTKLGLKRQGPGAIESISGVGYRFNE
jgi:two-component system KDP operon response regulator KdpE